MADLGRLFAELPSAEFPVLASLAGELGRDDSDGLFEFGLDVWLAGLEDRLRARAGGGRSRTGRGSAR